MSEKSRWEVPAAQQPRPEDVGFDLKRTLRSIVSLQAEIPEEAFTAPILGAERAGSGIVISESGLVLTIGYLVTEAEHVWLKGANGAVVPAHPISIDTETGFGLVQALGSLDLPALAFGSSKDVDIGDPVVLAGGGGVAQAVQAHIVAKEEFAGYWEYFVDQALFTAPAHPLWGGAGLIGGDGRLLGVGSLHVQQSSGRGETEDVNMIVPIDLLPPILDDLMKYGRVNRPPRPWLGVYSTESNDRVVVADVTEDGPAGLAGMRTGDVIAAVRDKAVETLADFYRALWACGPAGVEIPIEIVRDERNVWLRVKSADRASFLKKPRMN